MLEVLVSNPWPGGKPKIFQRYSSAKSQLDVIRIRHFKVVGLLQVKCSTQGINVSHVLNYSSLLGPIISTINLRTSLDSCTFRTYLSFQLKPGGDSLNHLPRNKNQIDFVMCNFFFFCLNFSSKSKCRNLKFYIVYQH